jgi:hypothetical protein
MFLIPLSWCITFFILISLGGGLATLYTGIKDGVVNNDNDIFQLTWLGYAVLIAILQIYSIFLPINYYAFLVIACISLTSFLFSYRYIYRSFLAKLRSVDGNGVLALFGTLAIIFITAYHAAQPLQHYDTELYHLNAVKWASSYPAVPGIVNIHGRLAFNSSFHLFAALLSVGYWSNRTVYIANSFILLVACIQWLVCLLSCPSSKVRLSYCFALVTSPFLILSILRLDISSLSTDLVTQVLILVFIYYVLDSLLIDDGILSAAPDKQFDVIFMMFILLLSSVIVSSKLSGVIVFIFTVTLITYTTLSSNKLISAHFIYIIFPAVVVIVGLLARYAILSGWLIYPFPIGNLHLEWSASPSQVQTELAWIRSWARMPGKMPSEVLGNGFYYWFSSWYKQFFSWNHMLQALLCSGVAGLLCLLLHGSTKQFRSNRAPLLHFSIMLTLAGLLFWFFTAPDLRFGEVFFWSFAGTSLAPVISTVIHKEVKGNFLAVTIVIFLSLQKLQGGFPEIFPEKTPFLSLPQSKSRRVVPVRIDNGQSPPLVMFRPLNGDRCGNSPLPCAPYIGPESHIELRTPGELRSGFRLRF